MYIPYFFGENKTSITVNCRNTVDGVYKSFIIPKTQWLIVETFNYDNVTEEETRNSLRDVFQTDEIEKKGKYYFLSNYTNSDYIESDYKKILIMPDDYITQIVLNKKRFYNLFTLDNEWTTNKGTGYPNIKDHHIFLIKDTNDNILYKRSSSLEYQILTNSIWETISDDIDIIFTTIFKDELDFKIPSRVDYAWISPYWYQDEINMEEWYSNNIKDLYLLSYHSSRNLSDILVISNREDWHRLTDDILLLTDIDVYNKKVIERYDKSYAAIGKFKEVYVYNMGDILIKALDESHEIVFKIFNHLTKFPHVISSLYNNEGMNPKQLILPENCIYYNEKFLYTLDKIDYLLPIDYIDYMIILGEGSYITFKNDTKIFESHGQHPICKPLFAAAKKAIESYMIWSLNEDKVNISIISNVVDKNKETLSVNLKLNSFNYKPYKEILGIDNIKALTTSNKSINIKFWNTHKGLSPVYIENDVIPSSCEYILKVLSELENLKKYKK